MSSDKTLPPEAMVWRGIGTTSGDEIPPPPYHVGGVDMLFLGVRFDEASVRKLLPPELNQVEANTVTVCVYTADHGWGIAPFSVCFVAIEVENFDSPDGSKGYYMAAGYFSGNAGIVMRKDYNLNFLEGRGHLMRGGGIAAGTGGPDGEGAMSIEASRFGDRPPPTTGIHHYLGRNRDGGTNFYSVAFTGEAWAADPKGVEIGELADERMRLAKPVELLWAFDCVGMTLSFSAPRPIGAGADALAGESSRASLVSVFSHLGRAAALVGPSGEIVVMNKKAEELIGDCLKAKGGRLRVAKGGDQAALDGIITAAVERGSDQFDLSPIAMERSDGHSLIARAMPIDQAVTDGPAAMIVFSDPSSDGGSDPEPALRLLGLTPAEARVARLVGSGLSTREAAAELDNSEGTVRTSLTHIYDKLDIHRQSELSRIVAQLETVGA